MVQRDFAKLVHQNRRARQRAHQMIQYRGFTAAEKTGEERYGEGGFGGHGLMLASDYVYRDKMNDVKPYII